MIYETKDKDLESIFVGAIISYVQREHIIVAIKS